ncbi:amino acid ABC transporter substrate-binding protein [Roseobacter ponti]|uniref:Amino acid ABC transporter substrate-binding protein n=1 Tax=Roseobacter ponti TaxID=1891787 RepID=A0A858ST57_9RHOB|nr:amino acid ABC transporter substrate-binding protein [Roseobacter ponti]QJF50056.1 amino acid ABC transporter substrate-binding protein [Roseobacter ponti]
MRFILSAVIALLALPVAAGAQTLDRIKSTGEIRLGFRTDAAPLSYQADNRPQGYTPIVCFALAPLIGEQLGLTDINVIFEPVDTKNRFEKVANGEIDLLCGASTITLARREIVDFSEPVYVDGTAVALRRDAPETLSGLSGQKIGVRSGTTTAEALENTLSREGLEAQIVSFSNHPDGMTALENDEIQAYFADQSILMDMVLNSENQDKLKIFEGILTVEKHGLAMARGDSDFRLAVDRALSELYANGSMAQAFRQAIPDAEPGAAIEAMYLLAPTLP